MTAKYLWDDHKGVLQLGSLGVLAPLGALLTQNKFIFSVHLLEIYTARQYTDLQHSGWNGAGSVTFVVAGVWTVITCQ